MAATESPPPTTVQPALAAIAAAIVLVLAAKLSPSHTPIRPVPENGRGAARLGTDIEAHVARRHRRGKTFSTRSPGIRMFSLQIWSQTPSSAT